MLYLWDMITFAILISVQGTRMDHMEALAQLDKSATDSAATTTDLADLEGAWMYNDNTVIIAHTKNSETPWTLTYDGETYTIFDVTDSTFKISGGFGGGEAEYSKTVINWPKKPFIEFTKITEAKHR